MSLNQSTERGLLIVVSGPSGVGKGTVLSELFSRDKNLSYSISATTRGMRPGEVDHVNYHFLSKEEFSGMIARGEMLEYAQYGDNFYGTPAAAVEQMRSSGRDVVLEIEVKGAMQVKERVSDAIHIMILPPSYGELEARLRGRGTECEADIEKRLGAAKAEITAADRYDYVIINDTVAEATARLETILSAERMRAQNKRKLIEEVLNHAVSVHS